jgi:hypothetical protein
MHGEFRLRRLGDGERSAGATEVKRATPVGRDMLVVAGAETEEIAKLVMAAAEALGGGEALEPAHASGAPFDAPVILLKPRWCTDAGEQTVLAPPGPWYQATRVETGFATRIMRLSTSAATATSPCWAGKRRARSFGPMIPLYLPTAVSARLRRP